MTQVSMAEAQLCLPDLVLAAVHGQEVTTDAGAAEPKGRAGRGGTAGQTILKDGKRTKVCFVFLPHGNRMDWHDRTVVNLNVEVIL